MRDLFTKKNVFEFAQMVAGNAICAFSVTCFALPYNMVVSGMSGIGRMVNIFTGASVSLVVAALNIALFITGALIGVIAELLIPRLLPLKEKMQR